MEGDGALTGVWATKDTVVTGEDFGSPRPSIGYRVGDGDVTIRMAEFPSSGISGEVGEEAASIFNTISDSRTNSEL